MNTSVRIAAVGVMAVLGTAGSAAAAWDNVFQVCCFDCCRPQTSFSAPVCPAPCPQPEVRISYVQRCYYQPVTEYVRRSYYEPVTRQVTTYYYEPVTTYRYSTYYDPCTGCPQQVCTPVTSYRLRSQCNSVTSYVERTALVPVTTLRPVNYLQPVVSYYYPPTQACLPACPLPACGTPQVDELRGTPPSTSPSRDMIPPPDVPTQPNMSNPRPNGGVKLRPEKTVSRSSLVTVRGEVTQPDQITPRSHARLVFLNAENPAHKEYVTANAYGEFDVRLPAGRWYLYIGGDDGRAVYHKQLTLGDRDTYDYRVVSR